MKFSSFLSTFLFSMNHQMPQLISRERKREENSQTHQRKEGKLLSWRGIKKSVNFSSLPPSLNVGDRTIKIQDQATHNSQLTECE